MLSAKHKIIRNFDRSTSTYSSAADVQAYVAGQLATRFSYLNPHSVLEIGCGTGLLSQRLINLFSSATLLLTDAAPAMLRQCQENLLSDKRVHFACMDGEHLALANTYDLIVSSMTLHWFMDLQRSCIDITQQLNRGGHFYFSILGENSFKEWRAICQAFKIPCGIPIFPAEHLLQTMLPNLEIEVEMYEQVYPNAYAFLSTLKNLGATASRVGYIPLSSTKLRQVLRHFDDEISISYEIIYAWYKRS